MIEFCFFFQDSENMPKVAIAVAIPKATPFLEEFFDSIVALEYPRQKLSIFIYNSVSFEIKNTATNYLHTKCILKSGFVP